jgi:hypothetical protein
MPFVRLGSHDGRSIDRFLAMSPSGLVSRVSPVQTALGSCRTDSMAGDGESGTTPAIGSASAPVPTRSGPG